MNSPMTMPIIAIVTPIFMPAKMNGIAQGNRARRARLRRPLWR
jgi:hypothetical protein